MYKFTCIFCFILLIGVNLLMFSSCRSETKAEPTTVQQERTEALQDKYISTDPEKNDLQRKFDAVLTRMDSLTVYNKSIEDKYPESFLKITKAKSETHLILLRDKLTPEEKHKATKLINEIDNALNTINKQNTTHD